MGTPAHCDKHRPSVRLSSGLGNDRRAHGCDPLRVARRLLTAIALAGLLLASSPAPGAASAPGAATVQRLAAQLASSREAIQGSKAAADQVAIQPPPPTALDAAILDMRRSEAAYRLRQAIRNEQTVIYRLAGDPALAGQVLARVPPASQPGVGDLLAGLRAAWTASGVVDQGLEQPLLDRRFLDSAPVETLLRYYQAAGSASGLDWTYLAAINYVESDFGRTNGPSASGALGPMQFMPGTWQEIGAGDISSPHDSIMAAGRLLRLNGAPADYAQAIFGYNNDRNYVESIQRLAAAMRADPLWLWRLYYWNTYG